MISRSCCIFFTIALIISPIFEASGGDFSTWSKDLQAELLTGEVVTLPLRPGERPGNKDKRYVTMAKLVPAERELIWEVIIDKDDTEKFLDGVLESRILSQKPNEIILEQRTKVGGPKGSYLYTLKYALTPMTHARFTYIKGDIRNVEGDWWIFEGPDPKRKLVIYSLHIDPGKFAPQAIVKHGIRGTVPSTITSTEAEVLRRKNQR